MLTGHNKSASDMAVHNTLNIIGWDHISFRQVLPIPTTCNYACQAYNCQCFLHRNGRFENAYKGPVLELKNLSSRSPGLLLGTHRTPSLSYILRCSPSLSSHFLPSFLPSVHSRPSGLPAAKAAAHLTKQYVELGNASAYNVLTEHFFH